MNLCYSVSLYFELLLTCVETIGGNTFFEIENCNMAPIKKHERHGGPLWKHWFLK